MGLRLLRERPRRTFLIVIYIDTSSLLKFLLPEAGGSAVETAIFAEEDPVISLLVRLEAEVQFRARRQGGSLRPNAYRALAAKLDALEKETPIAIRVLSSSLLEVALRQHHASKIHCRSFDRLHLAAMEELEITRLMTHDARQAEAARAQGFRVVAP